MTGWLAAFQQQYGIIVYRYEKTPSGIWMETNRGTMAFQSLPEAFVGKEAFVREIYQAMGEDSPYLLPVYPNQQEEILTLFGNQYYYLMRWPTMESEWMDYTTIGSSLARFHITSANALQDVRCRFSDMGNWSKIWRGKCEQLNKFEKIAVTRIGTDEEDPFDQYFVENVCYFKQVGELSLLYLDNCQYRQVCRNTMRLGRLSYTNFSVESFVTNAQGRVFFTHPFSLVEDIRVRDIAQFIKADTRDYGWNPHNMYSFLAAYHSISPLTPDEFGLMYALILLPGRFMKKLEALYYRPSFFQQEQPHVEIFREETERVTVETAYLEMKRSEVLIREFPSFVHHAFGVSIPSGGFSR